MEYQAMGYQAMGYEAVGYQVISKRNIFTISPGRGGCGEDQEWEQFDCWEENKMLVVVIQMIHESNIPTLWTPLVTTQVTQSILENPPLQHYLLAKPFKRSFVDVSLKSCVHH